MNPTAMKKMAEVLKTAEGRLEKYLPWYGAAGGGFAGANLGHALAPAKYKTIGSALGTLAGTAVGVHGGEAVGKKIDQRLAKTAATKDQPIDREELKKLFGRTAVATGGTFAGSLAGLAAGASLHGWKGYGPEIGALVGAAGGLYAGTRGAERLFPAKTAEAEEKPSHPAATLAKSVLGLGAGMGAGYASMKGLDHVLTKTRGRGLTPHAAMTAVPLVTGAIGMAAPYLHQMTLEKMRAAHLKKQETRHDERSS